MIGLLIVSHGRLAAEMQIALEHVTGPLDQIEAICIGPEDDMEIRRNEIATAVYRVDSGDGVIIATDLFGGTPSNLAISQLGPSCEVISGFNLPMLIRFDSARKLPFDEAIEALYEAGRKYISLASRLMDQQIQNPENKMDLDLEQVSKKLEDMSYSIAELQIIISKIPMDRQHGGLGHNQPPTYIDIEDLKILEEAELAADLGAKEILNSQPNYRIIKLCLNAIKRAFPLIVRISHWSIQKLDVFTDELAKSAGKLTGTIIIAATIAAAISKNMNIIIEILEKISI